MSSAFGLPCENINPVRASPTALLDISSSEWPCQKHAKTGHRAAEETTGLGKSGNCASRGLKCWTAGLQAALHQRPVSIDWYDQPVTRLARRWAELFAQVQHPIINQQSTATTDKWQQFIDQKRDGGQQADAGLT